MKGPYLITIALACLAAAASAQNNYVDEYDFDNAPPPPRPSRPANSFRPAPSVPRPTPVAILKQIDRHNDDGSYTYGYEGADGSFKIETKHVDGQVVGKYGYVDDTGKVRVVEYGANRYGFMPAGEGITVAPPTLVDETTKKGDRQNEDFFDDGSYYPEEPQPAPRPAPRPSHRARPAPRPQPQPQFDEYEPPPPPPPAPRRPSSSGSPVPPRPVIPGAAPVFSPAPVYEERPVPQRAPSQPRQQQPRYESLPPPPPPPPQRSAPSPQRFAPPPQPQRFAPPPPPPQPSHRAQHARSSSGILDQLERDYALPQGAGRLTHDISFGSY